MLCLTRHKKEAIIIGDHTQIKILSMKGREILFGIESLVDTQEYKAKDGNFFIKQKWRKRVQLYDMLSSKYEFKEYDGKLKYICNDKMHDGELKILPHQRDKLIGNLMRLLEALTSPAL